MKYQKDPIIRTVKNKTHCSAKCQDCEWESTDTKKAQQQARDHILSTGHTVFVDTSFHYVYQYNGQQLFLGLVNTKDEGNGER